MNSDGPNLYNGSPSQNGCGKGTAYEYVDVHGMIDCRILLDFHKRLQQLFWPWIEGTHVLFVEDHARVHIFLGVCGAVCFMLPDGLNELFREAGEEEIRALGKERGGGSGVGDDKPLKSFR